MTFTCPILACISWSFESGYWPWFLDSILCEDNQRHENSCRRRQWHPTPVLLPGKSHGWRSLVGRSPWGREESDMTEWLHFHFQALEKENSSVLAWRIQGTGEPYGLPSMGSHRVGHDWSDSAAAAAENACIMKCNWQLLFRVHLKQRFYSTFTCCLQTRPSCKSAYQYIAEFCFSLKSIIYSLKQWVVRRIYSWL